MFLEDRLTAEERKEAEAYWDRLEPPVVKLAVGEVIRFAYTPVGLFPPEERECSIDFIHRNRDGKIVSIEGWDQTTHRVCVFLVSKMSELVYD